MATGTFSQNHGTVLFGRAAGAGYQKVFQIYGTTEHLNAIVQRAMYLHVFEDGVRAATTQRKTIQFVVFVDLKASKFDAGILQYAATVALAGTSKLATEICLGNTLYCRVGLINRRFAEQNRVRLRWLRPALW
ncbi:hypothetical protein ACUN8V_02160 [Marinobacter nauticus]